jgi:GPI mannosyltransferase 3
VRRAALVGLLLGASIALRVQYGVPAFALWLLVLAHWRRRCALIAAFAGALVIGFAGLLDAWSWGTPFISYYNNLRFNLLLERGDAFGHSPPFAYVSWLTAGSAGLYLLAAIYGLLQWKRCWPILLLIACVLVPHSLIAHKEYRFVILVVPLLLVMLADAIANGTQRLGRVCGDRAIISVVLAIMATISAVECVMHGVFARDDRLLATVELSRRHDVAAVLDLTGFWSRSGGYYYLHQNVPLYFQQQIEAVPMSAVRSLVSHVIVPVTQAAIPGFRLSTRYRSVAILEQVSPPPAYRRLKRDAREPRQSGLDDRLDPGVGQE